MQYVVRCHNIVVELARRGIMSSICSKNDPARIKPLLEGYEIWDHFIFPSINWEAKGPRIAALIEAAQLRPGTVLFIDDEPANLAEALYYVPGLQTAAETIIPALLDDPRLAGKADPELSRLAQYKVLEARQADAAVLGGDNLEFLRASGIQVSFDYDVEANLDRAIELINRTNQLNFTKNRLPEDMNAAREELRGLVRQFHVFCGFIKVSDRYGDYGYAGFFLRQREHHYIDLKYFCFSCRLLSMGVETWTYNWLGRPPLRVAPGAVHDVTQDRREIDWITETGGEVGGAGAGRLMDRLVLRGGCDLSAMSHYLKPLTGEYFEEMNRGRGGRQFRTDNAMFLNHVFGEVPEDDAQALQSIGYRPEDWTSALARPMAEGSRDVWMFSFWTDGYAYLYKHKQLDVAAPFLLQNDPHAICDVTALSEERLRNFLGSDEQHRDYAALKRDFWGIGPIFEGLLRPALEKMVAAAAGKALVFVMLTPEYMTDEKSGQWVPRPKEMRFNNWVREVLAGKPDVHLVNILDFVEPGTMLPYDFHFDRLVYKRVAEHIAGMIAARFGAD